MYLQKVLSRKNCVKKLFFCWHLEGQSRKQQDPDPDPHQNVMDPQHWLQGGTYLTTVCSTQLCGLRPCDTPICDKYSGSSGGIVTLELASYLLAHRSLQQHSNFQEILFLLSKPIKVAQCLNAPLSFWQRTPYKKILHLFSGSKLCNWFFRVKSREQPFQCI